MGVLTNLLQLAWKQEDERRNSEITRYSTIAGLPNVQPEIQNWAIDELVKLGPKKAGGLKDVGELFKGLIGKQRGDGGSQQRFEQAKASTGRPEQTVQMPMGVPQGPQGAPGAPGSLQELQGLPRVGEQPSTSQTIPGIRPSMLMDPRDVLAQKLEQVRAEGQVKNDLAEQLEKFKNEEGEKAQLRLDQKRFDQQRQNVAALKAGGYSEEDAVGFVTGHYRPAESTEKLTRVPGTDPQLAGFKDVKPTGFYSKTVDKVTGKLLHYDQEAPPAGANDQLNTQLKGLIQSLKAIHPDWSDERIKKQAGQAYLSNFDATVDKKLLDTSIDRQIAEISGATVPAPSGTTGGAAAAPSRPAAGAQKPAVGGKVGGTTPPTSSAPAPSSDENLINQYLSQVLNPVPGSRGSKFTQLATMKGRKLLMDKTGLTPTSLDAALTAKKGTAKALQNAVTLQGGFERLQNTLTSFGDLLIDARSKVNDSGVSVLNRWVQAGMRAIPGDPDVAKLDVAANAVARIYSQILAGGYQSTAMPPVSSSEDAKQVLAGFMQKGRINGVVEQMKKEAATEVQAMQTQQQSLYDELAKPITEARPGGTSAPTPAPSATPKTPPAAGAKGKPKNADEEAAQWLANPH